MEDFLRGLASPDPDQPDRATHVPKSFTKKIPYALSLINPDQPEALLDKTAG